MRRLCILLVTIPAFLADYDITPRACFAPLLTTPKIDPKQEKCLATAIYGEARGESITGQLAMAYTIINRTVKSRKKTVCDIILAPKQYSIFNNNAALKTAAMSANLEPMQKNVIDKQSWQLATEIAAVVIRKQIADPGKGATHYVAYKSLNRIPKWTYKFTKIVLIGNHTFFKEEKT